MDMLAQQHVVEAEMPILKATNLLSMTGCEQIEVDRPLGRLRVSFNSGDAIITKLFDTHKAAYDWLLSMGHSLKSGVLDKSMRAAAKEVAPGVDLERAAASQTSKVDLSTAVDTLQGAQKLQGDGGIKDVTKEFMEVTRTHTAHLPESVVCLHKGSMNSVTTLAASNPSTVALLLGKKAWNDKLHCMQFVLSTTTVADLAKHDRVAARCKTLGFSLVGAVVTGPYEEWASQNKRNEIFDLLDFSNPLLVTIDFSANCAGDLACWELSRDNDDTMKAVSISWVTQPKDRSRRHCYNVCWINDLGTSHIEATAKQVCASVLQHLKSQTDLLAKADRTKQMKLSYFEKVSTIADGWCGWHSMLAARDVQRYLKVGTLNGTNLDVVFGEDAPRLHLYFHFDKPVEGGDSY
ncbi:unnamed protein product, partial [Durusdinium trenchii]